MGLLGKLFGNDKHAHPPLDPNSPAAARLQANKGVFEAFAQKLHDKLEFIPGERTTYVFIGKPPEMFGIAWFEGAEEHNLKRLMADKKLPQRRINQISEELRVAYQQLMEEPRFTWELGGKKVTVTPSARLEAEVSRIIHVVES